MSLAGKPLSEFGTQAGVEVIRVMDVMQLATPSLPGDRSLDAGALS